MGWHWWAHAGNTKLHGPVPRTERDFWMVGCWSEDSGDRMGEIQKNSVFTQEERELSGSEEGLFFRGRRGRLSHLPLH